MEALQYFLDLGSSVVMPVIITVIGLIVGQKPSTAVRSGLTIGIGLIAISLVTGLMGQYVSPAAQAMVDRMGLQLDVIDVGWTVSSAIAFSTTIVPFVFVVCFVINLIMLALNWTKTLDIDFWNYWHFVLTGALIQFATGSMVLGVIGSAISFVIIIKFADYSAPYVQEYYEMPGVSLPHTETVSWAPIFIGLEKVYDKIPGFNKVQITTTTLQEKLGFFGEPMMLGIILGAGIGLLAGYDFAGVCQIAINMAAVMFLLPRMVKILMEGLIPLSNSDRDFMNKRFPGKEVYIGLDAAVGTGSPMVVSASLIMIPITLLLAFILPGNKLLPLVDLATLPFFMIWPVVAHKGNLFRALISGTLMMIAILYIGTDLAPVATAVAESTQYAFPEGATMISSLDIGAHLVPYIVYRILALFA